MSIDKEFPNSHHVIRKQKHANGEHYHFIRGPGRSDAETSSKSEVQNACRERGEEYVPLGIHDTIVAVNWDSCYADEACIESLSAGSISSHHMDTKIPVRLKQYGKKLNQDKSYKYEINCLLEGEEGDTY